jgi:TFIIF-interacting CTD phosphatase-like protein
MNFILDLDNTLVCAVPFGDTDKITLDIEKNYDFTLFHPFDNLMYLTKIYARPYLKYFLLELSKLGTITVWTGSKKIYAEHIINNLFPKDIKVINLFSNFYTNKLYSKYNLMKPIKYLENDNQIYNILNTIIIDDDKNVIKANPDNSIQISKFTKESIVSNRNDNELIKILKIIKNKIRL